MSAPFADIQTDPLAADPKPGTSAETVIYSDGAVVAVVNATTGLIVTLWWIL
jgi:hypothetical protein